MLFMCGSKDASLAGTKALNVAIAGSKLVEIPSAGHISNLENPDLFTRTLKDFLTR
jgi:pimeloyl-ACP methyl ester carboxylesterase